MEGKKTYIIDFITIIDIQESSIFSVVLGRDPRRKSNPRIKRYFMSSLYKNAIPCSFVPIGEVPRIILYSY